MLTYPNKPDKTDVPQPQPQQPEQPEQEPLRRTTPEVDPPQTPEVPATPPRQTPPSEVPVQGVGFCVAVACALLPLTACKREKEPTTAQVRQQVAEEPGDVAPGNAFAMADITGKKSVSGKLRFMAPHAGDETHINILVNLNDAPPGTHGLHVHEFGDCSDVAMGSAGKHWSIDGEKHGAPDTSEHHTGDLGNVTVAANGVGAAMISIAANADVRRGLIGRSVILHAKADDLQSQPAGDSGDPIACGVISATDVLPVH